MMMGMMMMVLMEKVLKMMMGRMIMMMGMEKVLKDLYY